jgi:hypothetical protein
MSSPNVSINAGAELAAAARALVRRPFFVLLCLSYLLALVGTSISLQFDASNADASFTLARASSIIIEVLGIYLQIAVVLVAGSSGEPASADPWMRAAFKHRCFWRFFAVTVLEVFAMLLGFVAVVVGAAIVGGIVALGQAAVVLERRQPVDALRRSAALTGPVRGPVALIFFVLFAVPVGAGVVLLALGIELPLGWEFVVTVVGATTSFMASIALTRIFVKLGGAPTPPVQTLLYKAARPGSR